MAISSQEETEYSLRHHGATDSGILVGYEEEEGPSKLAAEVQGKRQYISSHHEDIPSALQGTRRGLAILLWGQARCSPQESKTETLVFPWLLALMSRSNGSCSPAFGEPGVLTRNLPFVLSINYCFLEGSGECDFNKIGMGCCVIFFRSSPLSP